MLSGYIQIHYKRLIILLFNLFVIPNQKIKKVKTCFSVFRSVIPVIASILLLSYLCSISILTSANNNVSYNAFAIVNTFSNNTNATTSINNPPIANAGINQTVNENTTVVLNGVASDPDPGDSNKLSYSWKQISGSSVNLSNNTSTNPSFTAPDVSSDRELRFSLIAKDEKGAASNPAIVTITVKHVNRSPIADAGENQTISPGDVVTLDGGKSNDPDNDPLSYSWMQIAGPIVKLENGVTPIASFTTPSNISADTDLNFRLTVEDDKNATSTDDIRVRIKHVPPPNKPPVANAGLDQTVNAGDTVMLDGTKSRDPDGNNITSYFWEQIAGPDVILNGADTATPSFTALSNVSANTALVFQLTVTDDKNATSISPVKITVKPANRPPVANAGVNQTVNAGDVVTLDGSKSNDPDNDQIKYLWKQIAGTPAVTINGDDKPIATFTAPSDIASDTDLTFELTVTDDKNGKSTAISQVTVKYVPPPNQPPIVDAGPDQTVNAGDVVTLDGSGSSDPEGDQLSYSWTQTAGPSVSLDDANVPSLTFTAPSDVASDTDLAFELTVTDDKNGKSTGSTLVTLKAVTPSSPTTDMTNESKQETGAVAEEYKFVRKWGSHGTGDGQFNLPNGIAVDSYSENVYVTELSNNRIQKFDSNGNFITKWGSKGTGDGQFDGPNGIAVDSSGNVYVADSFNSRIQKFDSNGNFITKWGLHGQGNGQFILPNGIAVDSSGNVYVADTDNNRIQKFDSNGNFITKWGSKGTGDGQFNLPNGIAVDSSGNVYVTDLDNNRIQKFDSNGNFITKWGSKGTGDGQFDGPNGIAVDSSGNVYVTEDRIPLNSEETGNRIQKFDTNGNFIAKWGSYGTGDGQLDQPSDIAVNSSSGKAYVVDLGNTRIQVFASSNSTYNNN